MRRPWVTKYRGDIHLKLPKRRHRTFSGQPAETRTASAGPVSETSLSDIPADAESPLLAQHASEPEQVAVELSPEESADTGIVSEYPSAAPFNPVPQPDFEYQAPPNSIFEEEPAAAGGQEEDLVLERSFRPVLEEPAEIIADLPEQPVLGEPSYVALEWRRPSILFLALGWLLSAYAGPVVMTLLQGGMPALMTATGWMGIGVMGPALPVVHGRDDPPDQQPDCYHADYFRHHLCCDACVDPDRGRRAVACRLFRQCGIGQPDSR